MFVAWFGGGQFLGGGSERELSRHPGGSPRSVGVMMHSTRDRRRVPLGAKGEALAKQFEGKVQEATTVVEKLSDADWRKTTSAEKWSVGVVAHHVATGHEGIAGIIKTVSGGQSMPHFTMDMLHAMNAKHAQEHASCTKAETLALHKKN